MFWEPFSQSNFQSGANPPTGEDIWVLRLFEANGKETEAVISLPLILRRAVLSNILEEEGESLPVAGNQIKVQLPAHRIVTVKVWM